MPPQPGPTLIEALSWPAQRWLYCRNALRQRAKRWAGWAAMALLLANIGSNDPVATTLGLLGLGVMPLFAASQAGLPAWCLATAVYGGLISLLLRALRPVLWSARWLDSTQALPLPAASLRHSDRLVLGVALAPVALLLVTGWAVWASHAPDRRWAAAAAVASALAAAYGVGCRLLRAWRSPPAPLRATLRQARATATLPRLSAPLPAWRALVWQAWWQGPAQRTGRWLLGGAALLLGMGVWASFTWPAQLPWTLAVTSLGSWVWLTRAQALSDEQLAPLLVVAATHLPLTATRLQRWRQLSVLAPAWSLVSLLGGLAAMAAPTGLLRPTVLCAWWLCLLAMFTLEVMWPPAEVANRSARWWLFSVVLVALSSEVLR